MTHKKILFTPVGTTDPTFKNSDGSIVQAIKQLKPDKVYLYLSYDMKVRERKTNIVANYLKLLNDSGINFEYQFFKTDKLENENPQLFDNYYHEFNALITEIVQENSSDEIELYLNISSGTPAMKSTLFLLASSLNIGQFQNLKKLSAMQVNSPNSHHQVKIPTETAQELYDQNDDKTDVSGKRAYISQTPNVSSYLTRREIIKFIDTFDYNAALKLAQSIRNSVNSEVIALLMYGKDRRNLDLNKFIQSKQANWVDKKLLRLKFTTAKTTLNSPKISRDLYEYLLNLSALAYNNDYLNFIRGLSPALSVLFADALKLTYPYLANEEFYKKDGGFGCFKIPENISFKEKDKLEAFRKKTKENMGITTKKLSLTNAAYPFLFYTADSFFKSPLSTSERNRILRLLTFLRLIEDSSRNIVAHEIVALSSATITQKAKHTLQKYKQETGESGEDLTGNALIYKNTVFNKDISPKSIFAVLKSLCRLIYSDIPEEPFEDYKQLNDHIKIKLDN